VFVGEAFGTFQLHHQDVFEESGARRVGDFEDPAKHLLA
jgi:hypothetical protein